MSYKTGMLIRLYASDCYIVYPQSNQSGHRLSHHKHNSNDPDVLQVPIALAMTQLLLQLPEETLNSNLPGWVVVLVSTLAITVLFSLLLKVCHTLRSYQRDVREVARNTLVKMASLLGPKYLHFILKEMKETLTKGYQVYDNILKWYDYFIVVFF